MPLIRIDVVRGRSEQELRALTDSVHAAVVRALSVPQRDRYQIVTQHEPGEIVAWDTGLGIERSNDLVIIQVVSRIRTEAHKLALYESLADHLERDTGLSPNDLIVTITENGLADWSFAEGRAQFVTNELV